VRIVWTELALASLALIRQYIDTDNPRAARAVSDRIKRAVRQLEIFPQVGRPALRAGTRELVIAGLPYVVVYRIGDNRVEVLRVFHTKQLRS
jgi:toxin ParE1/3/4